MTTTAVLEPPNKLNRYEAELVDQIWNELARIYGWRPVKDSDSPEVKANRHGIQIKILKRHINRPDGTLKTVPCLIDQRNELRNMDPVRAEDDRQ